MVPGWFNAHGLYDRMAAEATDNSWYVEVGAWLGRSTLYMARLLRERGVQTRFDVIDTWLGSPGAEACELGKAELAKEGHTPWSAFIRNATEAGLIDRIHPFRVESTVAARMYDAQSLDFVYLDADHSYESVKEDILTWLPKLKPGGVLAGDDYTESWAGVIQAVAETLGPVSIEGVTWIYEVPRS
jgi:hypothetical protein